MIRTLIPGLLCAMASLVSGTAHAAVLSPSSYDMLNGDGQAHGGNFNYWDQAYTGSGDTTTDGAALSGGLGDLTDGVTTTQNWYQVENAAGTGPFVGWRRSHVGSPAITFHFAKPVDIAQVKIHADDSRGTGGVSLPSGVAFNWLGGSLMLAAADPDPGSDAPSWLEFSLQGASGVSDITVTPQYGNEWIFIDEVQFVSAATVPEPSTCALLAVALTGLGLAGRRRSA